MHFLPDLVEYQTYNNYFHSIIIVNIIILLILTSVTEKLECFESN